MNKFAHISGKYEDLTQAAHRLCKGVQLARGLPLFCTSLLVSVRGGHWRSGDVPLALQYIYNPSQSLSALTLLTFWLRGPKVVRRGAVG